MRLSRKEPRQLRSSPRGTAPLAIFGENSAHANSARPGVPAPEAGRRDDTASLRAVRIDLTPAAWRGGFREARRHSVRVWALRRTAIAGSVLAIAFIFAAVLIDPLRHLPVDFSVKRVGLEGTKITVEFPRVSGLQKNGRPFEIKARSGVQDVAVSNIIELQDIESALGTAESSTTWVSAAHGIYDSLHDKLTLEGNIHIKSSTGYDIWLKSARIDFKSGSLVSEEPVRVALDGGAVEANQLDVSDNGHKVSFGGAVTSTIENSESEPDDPGEMAEIDP